MVTFLQGINLSLPLIKTMGIQTALKESHSLGTLTLAQVQKMHLSDSKFDCPGYKVASLPLDEIHPETRAQND